MRSKHRKGKKSAAAPGPAAKPASVPSVPLRRNKWLLVLALTAVAGGISFVVFQAVLPGAVPDELVGEWRVAGGPLHGMTMEFKRNGTMTGRATVNGVERELEGRAEVTGNTIKTTTTNPTTGRSETGTQTIVTLNETEFVTDDGKGTRITMKRVH